MTKILLPIMPIYVINILALYGTFGPTNILLHIWMLYNIVSNYLFWLNISIGLYKKCEYEMGHQIDVKKFLALSCNTHFSNAFMFGAVMCCSVDCISEICFVKCSIDFLTSSAVSNWTIQQHKILKQMIINLIKVDLYRLITESS